MARKYAWSWADYEREKRKYEQVQARDAAREKDNETPEAGIQTADSTGGCEGQAAEGQGREPLPDVPSGAAEGLVHEYPANACQACETPAPAEPPREPEPRARAVPIELATSRQDAPPRRATQGWFGAGYEARTLHRAKWCDQCQLLVDPGAAAACTSAFCKAKAVAA